MQLIAPDVLAEARGLSPVLSGAGVVVGLLLWLCGWRWHRFWVVASVTVAGGLVGLHSGRASGGHLLAAGLLLAISAGVLALELARVVAFLAGGTAVWCALRALMPAAQELWIGFLLGGLLGVLLYRLWTTLLTSFVGILLGWHAGLCLLERFAKIDAASFAESHALILNGGVIAATVLGLVAQSLLERWLARRKKKPKPVAPEKKPEPPKPEPPPEPASWWDWMKPGKRAA